MLHGHLCSSEINFYRRMVKDVQQSWCLVFRITVTRPVPVEGKSSVCLICMKYRIIMLIIIIISMGKISLSYIANTSRTHSCMHARAHMLTLANTHTPTPTHDCRCSRPTMTPSWLGDPFSTLARQCRSLAIH